MYFNVLNIELLKGLPILIQLNISVKLYLFTCFTYFKCYKL